MRDTIVFLGPGARELERRDEAGVLGAEPFESLLDSGSQQVLEDALTTAPTRGLELITLDGTILDATVLPEEGRWAVVVRDVTRYARTAEHLGGMAVALARRNRDLRTLYEAADALDASLDLGEIARTTCSVVAAYLDADQVVVDVVGTPYRWVDATSVAEASGRLPLRTPRGEIGELSWWREGDLLPNEQEVLPLLASRAAIGLDHALLLSSAEERAARDPLTGLLNRDGGRRALAGLVPPFAVVLLDLDHFKRVNDVHGHAEGDRVLREVAAILQHGRASDVKVRWGGEEFLVALDRMGVDRAVRWAEERLAEVRRTVRVAGDPVAFSAGIALADVHGLEPALRRADEALYRAKDQGRARVVAAPVDG